MILYDLQSDDSPLLPGSTTYTLQKVAEWNHNYTVSHLLANEDTLVLGDVISSISVIKLDNGKLQTVGRDYGPLWPVAVGDLGNGNVIAANVFLPEFSDQQITETSSIERLQFCYFQASGSCLS